MKKSKSTFYYRIGKSNWYRRVDARGNEVKVQLSKKKFSTRNKIIRGLRRYYKEKRKPVPVKRKPRVKRLDHRVFDLKRPKKIKVITIYGHDKKIIINRSDVRSENFYEFFRRYFNFYYELIVTGDVYYTIENQ